jgi:hypothetical protein
LIVIYCASKDAGRRSPASPVKIFKQTFGLEVLDLIPQDAALVMAVLRTGTRFCQQISYHRPATRNVKTYLEAADA